MTNEKNLKFEQFMRIIGMDGLSFEQKVEKLDTLDIPYRIECGSLVYGKEGETAQVDYSNLSIMQCMSEIIDDLKIGDDKEPKFNKGVFETKAKEIGYVCKMCGVSAQQAVLLACVIEQSGHRHFDKEDLARYMGMSYPNFPSRKNFQKSGTLANFRV